MEGRKGIGRFRHRREQLRIPQRAKRVPYRVRRGVTFSGAYLDLPDQVPYGDLNAAVSSSMGQPAIAKKKTALDRPFTRRNGQNMLGTTALRYAILAGSSQSDSRHLVWLGPSEAPCCRVRSRVSTARARLASAGSRSGYPAMAREKIGSWRTHSPIASTTKREPHPDRCRGSGHPSDALALPFQAKVPGRLDFPLGARLGKVPAARREKQEGCTAQRKVHGSGPMT